MVTNKQRQAAAARIAAKKRAWAEAAYIEHCIESSCENNYTDKAVDRGLV